MIELAGVSFAHLGRPILDRISLHVKQGESVALVGPNGSGKTSILRCTLGLVPCEGTVRVGGFELRANGVAARRLTGYMPQRAAFGDVRAFEVLAFTARLLGHDGKRAQSALDRVGLASSARERVRTFSGGMLQRLSLGLMLLADPPVLLLDEPTASLDGEGQRLFFELADAWRTQGRTLLLTSHRAEDLGRLSDRVVTLDRGRIAAAPDDPGLKTAGHAAGPAGRGAP